MELPRVKKFTAREVIALLAERHKADVFVPECKDGPTWAANHFRLDAWAMARSWSNPVVSGYEVKVSRSDFLRDDKWQAYLACCNQLYFVCPHGLIKPEEVSEQVGLIYIATTGTRLFVKKKAHYRDVEIPEPVWRYIVMNRAQIVHGAALVNGRPSGGQTREDRMAYWREWLAEKEQAQGLGYRVSEAVRSHVEAVEEENRRLNLLHARYDRMRETLVSLGFDPEKERINDQRLRERLEQLQKIVTPDRIKRVRAVAQEMEKAAAELEALTVVEPNL